MGPAEEHTSQSTDTSQVAAQNANTPLAYPISANTTYQQSYQQKSHKTSLIVAVVVLLIAIGSAATWYLMNKSSRGSGHPVNQPTSQTQNDQNNQANVATRGIDPKILADYTTTFYKPSASTIHSALLTKSANPDGNELLVYEIGSKASGTASSPPIGKISVTEYAATSRFNPPTDCGPYFPGGIKSSTPLPCRLVVNSSFKGYAYEGRTPGTIDYVGSAGQPSVRILTLYAKNNNTVIIIQSWGVDSGTIVKLMGSMTTLQAQDLPKDTVVTSTKR